MSKFVFIFVSFKYIGICSCTAFSTTSNFKPLCKNGLNFCCSSKKKSFEPDNFKGKSSLFCKLPKLILHNRSHASEPSSYQCAGSANELRSFNARHDINLGACHHCGHSLSSFQNLAPPPLGLRLYYRLQLLQSMFL